MYEALPKWAVSFSTDMSSFKINAYISICVKNVKKPNTILFNRISEQKHKIMLRSQLHFTTNLFVTDLFVVLASNSY